MCAGPNCSQTGWHPVPGITAGLPQAWIREGVFSYLLQWFWISELSPASVHFYLALSHLSAVFLGFVPMVLFAYQQELPCTGYYASCHCWVHLNLTTVPKGAVGSAGWSCALFSPEPWFPLTVGDCEFALCRMGDISI